MTTVTLSSQNNGFAEFGTRIMTDSMKFSLFCKDVVQGLLSGLMVIAGSAQMMVTDYTGSVLPAGFSGAFFEDLFSGRMMGVMQIAVAALLFISTRRGSARTLGILALLGYVAFHNSGVTLEAVLSGTSSLLVQLAEQLEQTSMKLAVAMPLEG